MWNSDSGMHPCKAGLQLSEHKYRPSVTDTWQSLYEIADTGAMRAALSYAVVSNSCQCRVEVIDADNMHFSYTCAYLILVTAMG